jgi:tetratricopeptide (TPR) repeat protein
MVWPVPTGKLTPADELRDLLGRVERRLANVGSASAEQLLELMGWLDQIVTLIAELEAQGVDLRPERTRLESIEGILRSKAGQIVRRTGLALARRREEVKPDESHWWWWLDRFVLIRTRQRLQRMLIGLAVVAILIVGGYAAFHYFFPTNPNVEKAQGLQLTAERLAMEGNWAGAEEQLLQALEYTPDDAILWTWLGVVREKQGNQAGADEAFTKARSLSQTELDYLLAKGQVYIQSNQGDKALAEAEKAVKLAPDSAQAHFLLAGAYELLGRQLEAIQEFEKTAALAEEKEPQLVVLARMRMGMLLQTLGVSLPTTGTVTTTTPAP